ncbi:intermembrane transport protein PqiB [Propionivibrio sp.]|uniref:PqiB family protein n=1 Tax=Propionivibrio sp. TaxID=2212460 RepID=UPI003BF05EE9
MTNIGNEPGLTDLPEATASKSTRSLSLVWLIPFIAAIIGGWIAIKTHLDKGPTITITFKSAEGIEAGKTKLRFNEVKIGEVKEVLLSKDHTQVVVTAELVKDAENFLVDDSRFWVVKPRIAGGQISGLNTLLSGSYIGVDIGKSEIERDEFIGLEVQPIMTGGLPGRHFILHAHDLGSLDIGAPVYFRRIKAGWITAYDLENAGKGVTVNIFIQAPYDQYVSSNTRFWNASGVDVALGSEGLSVRTEGLISLIVGGIAFQSPSHASLTAGAAPEDSAFDLYASREAAMRKPTHEVVPGIFFFDQSVRGLSPGAPIDFRGVQVGEVQSISLELDTARKNVRAAVEVNLYPEQFWARVRGGAKPTTEAALMQLWDTLIAKGLRAQLNTGSLITGQLYVSLDFFPDTKKSPPLDWSKSPVEFPTISSTLESLQNSLVKLMKKLESIPVEQISADLHKALVSLDETLKSTSGAIQNVTPELRATLESANKALLSADKVLSAGSPLQQDARETLREVTRAAAAVRDLADYLERHPESLIRGKQEEVQK